MRFIIDQNDQHILNAIQQMIGFGTVKHRSKTKCNYRFESTGYSNKVLAQLRCADIFRYLPITK